MANFLSGFLNNLGQGLTQQKGNLGDFQHAARLYNAQAFRLAPKVKFLYHVVFNINPRAARSTSFDAQRHGTAVNMLVKQIDLPKFKVSLEQAHQYNRKKQVQTKLEYDPISVIFHDDNVGLTTAMWSLYYGYYYADGKHGGGTGAAQTSGLSSLLGNVTALLGIPRGVNGSASASRPAAYNRNSYKNETANKYRYGLDNNSSEPFFTSIQIFQLSRKTYQSYTLINPIIQSWQHDTLNNSEGNGTVQSTMQIAYEAVIYGQGAVSTGNPSGFATEYYDKAPSPLSLLGGGSRSLFGQGGVLGGIGSLLGDLSNPATFTDPRRFLGTLIKGANVVRNAKSLTKEGIRQEGFGVLKNAIGATAGIDVSGVANIAFPKKNGNGQNQTTQALGPPGQAPSNALSTQNQTLISNTPGALNSLTNLAISSGIIAPGPNAQSQAQNLISSGRNIKFNGLANKVVSEIKG
jgi:hypothetical protein